MQNKFLYLHSKLLQSTAKPEIGTDLVGIKQLYFWIIFISFSVVKKYHGFHWFIYFLLSYKSTYSRDATRFSIPGGQEVM